MFLSVHSYRGGTGKSSISANLRVFMAGEGLNVGLVDMDLQSPGLGEETLLSIALSDVLLPASPCSLAGSFFLSFAAVVPF